MKLQDFDGRIWNNDEKTLTYLQDYKLSIGYSNPQQDEGNFESELHAYYDNEPMCPSSCELELFIGLKDVDDNKIMRVIL